MHEVENLLNVIRNDYKLEESAIENLEMCMVIYMYTLPYIDFR